ncbi:MAG TPA: hypothetical protein VHR86_03430, partial [Armatimonadota bacterium]|nr:hypothetical protein [Armatimonadota bacterium]
MPYRYVTERSDYSRFASGGVFYHLSGHPAFPVRLMSEVFQRCMAFRRAKGCTGPCVLYDPCCGAAYHLSTLAYLHWREIRAILCSDIDPTALATAKSNLSLLTTEGMDRRCAEIAAMQSQYGKESHAQALAYAQSLQEELLALQHSHSITTRIFQADALQPLLLAARL